MNDNDDIRTIPDPSPSSAPTPAAETKSPAQPPFAVAQLPPAPLRIPLAVLNVAWVITGYTPDEFLRSLDVLVELAPGVLVEPQQLQWHPMLNRFVYLSPNGGMFDLERIVRALKLGDDVEPYCRDDNGTPFDPGKWRQLSFVIPGDDEPYCSRQRYDAVLGTTFQVFELVNRDTRPHQHSGRWLAQTSSREYYLVDTASGGATAASFDSAEEAMRVADQAILAEIPDYRWLPAALASTPNLPNRRSNPAVTPDSSNNNSRP